MRSTILALLLCSACLGCAGSAGSAVENPAPCPPDEPRGTESFTVRAAAAPDGPADGTRGALLVRVSLGTEERPPRPGAFVDLWRQGAARGGSPLRSGTTNRMGMREWRNIPAGEYDLVVSAVSSDSVGRPVTVRAGYTDTLDVTLNESTICPMSTRGS